MTCGAALSAVRPSTLASPLYPAALDDRPLSDGDFDITKGRGLAAVQPSNTFLHECQPQNVTPRDRRRHHGDLQVLRVARHQGAIESGAQAIEYDGLRALLVEPVIRHVHLMWRTTGKLVPGMVR